MMEAICTSKTSVYFYETTLRHVPEASCELSYASSYMKQDLPWAPEWYSAGDEIPSFEET
jgi:hypothetical protein